MREFDLTDECQRFFDKVEPEPSYSILKKNGFAYAVFKDCGELDRFADRYPHYFEGYYICCFGGYYNAVDLGRLH